MDQDPYSAKEKRSAREILLYLENHPRAKDTLDGISHWWLLSELSARKLQSIERTISYLLSKNLILATRRKGLPVYYGRNPRKRKHISNILKGS